MADYILRVSISLLSVHSFELEVKSPWAFLDLNTNRDINSCVATIIE